MITLIKESNIMGKLLKYSFYLIIIILLFLMDIRSLVIYQHHKKLLLRKFKCQMIL